MPDAISKAGLPPLTPAELETRRHLQQHVEMLAGHIGGRSASKRSGLARAADYIETQLRSAGYSSRRHAYQAQGMTFENIDAGPAPAGAFVVIGAHYDTAGGLPGANDNGSGVAATLELARLFAQDKSREHIQWALFANEEPPWFQTEAMGSYVYAKGCRQRRENIAAMLSLETIGYYSDAPGSQQYPVGFHPGYPDTGNFLGFVSDLPSAMLLRRVLTVFRANTSLPAQGAAAPAMIAGVGWSDHWSFWQFGYRAVMVTDTAPFRYPHYHTAADTPEKLDYDRMSRAVSGLAAVVRDLAGKRKQ